MPSKNTRPIGAKDLTELEQMLDRSSLFSVLIGLAEICEEKADHIRANWQDRALAKLWDQAGTYVRRASFARDVSGVSD